MRHFSNPVMQLFDGFNAEELHRLLGFSRWLAALLFALALVVFAFNQWIGGRLASAQQIERTEALRKLATTENELREIREKTSEVASKVEQLTSPRKLSLAQIKRFPSSISPSGPGKVIVTYLTVEWDAEDYARQLGHMLQSAGLNTVVSDYLWMELHTDGVYLTGTGNGLPTMGAAIQRAFEGVGVKLPLIPSPELAKAVGAAPDDTVLVVSNRN
jgi:hypothetical protein